MIGKVAYSIAIIAWLQYKICSAAIQVHQVEAGEYVLLLDYSALSASCANETLQLVRDSYADVKFSGLSCYENNQTSSKCMVTIPDRNPGYETNCMNAGGRYLFNQTKDDFYTCTRNKNGEFYTVDVMIANYPFCVGMSCTESEVQLAFDTTISADAEHGPIHPQIEQSCDINPFANPPLSSAHNRFDVVLYTVGILMITFYLTHVN
jgi:hypothetical protein